MILAPEYAVQNIKPNNHLYLPEESFYFFKVRWHSLAGDLEHLMADPDCLLMYQTWRTRKVRLNAANPNHHMLATLIDGVGDINHDHPEWDTIM